MKTKSLIAIILFGAMFVSGAYAEVTTEHENANGQSPKKKEYRIRLPGGDLVGVQNAPDNQTKTGTLPATVLNRPILSPVVAPLVTKSLTLSPLPAVAPVAPTVPTVPLKLMNPPVLTVNPVLPPVVTPPVITALPILPVILPPPVPVIVIPPPPIIVYVPPVIRIPIVYVPPPRIPLKTVALK